MAPFTPDGEVRRSRHDATPARAAAHLVTALAAALAVVTASDGATRAHSDKERSDKMRSGYSAGTDIPLISSANVDWWTPSPARRASPAAS